MLRRPPRVTSHLDAIRHTHATMIFRGLLSVTNWGELICGRPQSWGLTSIATVIDDEPWCAGRGLTYCAVDMDGYGARTSVRHWLNPVLEPRCSAGQSRRIGEPRFATSSVTAMVAGGPDTGRIQLVAPTATRSDNLTSET